MNNRYFIINLSLPIMIGLMGKIVGNFQEQRVNNSKTSMIIKLKELDNTEYAELQGFQEYTYEQIVLELQKPEWNENDILI